MYLGKKDVSGIYRGNNKIYNSEDYTKKDLGTELVTDSTILHYDFSGKYLHESNSPITDLSGNGNDGQLTNFNGTYQTSGYNYERTGLIFDGINDYIRFNELLIPTGQEYTIEIVISELEWENKDIEHAILGQSNDISSSYKHAIVYGLDYYNANNKFYRINYYTSDSISSPQLGIINTQSDHKFLAYNFKDSNLTVSIDNILQDNLLSHENSFKFNIIGRRETVGIGGRIGDYFKGILHTIRIHNRSLTEDELTHNYNLDNYKYFGVEIPVIPTGRRIDNITFRNNTVKAIMKGTEPIYPEGYEHEWFPSPEIQYDGEVSFTVEYDSGFTIPTVTVIDDEDPNPTLNIEITDPKGNIVENIDFTVSGDYIIKYTATNKFDMRDTLIITLTVEEYVDDIAPVIHYDGPNPVILEYDSEFNIPTVTVTDNWDEDIEVSSVVIMNSDDDIISEIDTEEPGDYRIIYTAHDKADNSVSLVINVTIKEGTPYIIYDGPNPVIFEYGEEYTRPDVKSSTGLTYSSARDSDDSTVNMSDLDTTMPGEYIFRYEAVNREDRTIRSPLFELIVIVKEYVDTIDPIIHYDGPTTITIEYEEEFIMPDVTVTDNWDEEPSLTYIITDPDGIEVSTIDTTNPGDYTIVYTAEDSSGNTDTLTIYFEVQEGEVQEGEDTEHIQDGLLLYYDFSTKSNSDSDRNIIEDLSGNNKYGQLYNFNFSGNSGYNGNGLEFDGVDDYIRINNGVNFDREESFTIEIVTSNDARGNIFTDMTHLRATDASNYSTDYISKTNNSADFYFPNRSLRFTGLNTVPNYKVFDYDSGEKRIRGLINNDDSISPPYTGTGELLSNGFRFRSIGFNRATHMHQDWRTGFYIETPIRFFSGPIHAIRIYNRRLTREELTQNYEIDKDKYNL